MLSNLTRFGLLSIVSNLNWIFRIWMPAVRREATLTGRAPLGWRSWLGQAWAPPGPSSIRMTHGMHVLVNNLNMLQMFNKILKKCSRYRVKVNLQQFNF
jgi:hypothetical protein